MLTGLETTKQVPDQETPEQKSLWHILDLFYFQIYEEFWNVWNVESSSLPRDLGLAISIYYYYFF